MRNRAVRQATGMRVAALVALGLGIAGCTGAMTPPTADRAPLIRSLDLGTISPDLEEPEDVERCRLVPNAPPEGMRGATAYAIRCGAWEAPAARLVQAAGDRTLSGWLTRSAWRESLDQRATCASVLRPTTIGGREAVTLTCTVTAGRWPYHAFAVSAGADGAWLVDSVPLAAPAVLRSLAVLSGGAAVPVGSSELDAEIAALEAALGSLPYGPDEPEAFMDKLRLAQLYNFQGEHALAERAYDELIERAESLLASGEEGKLPTRFVGLAFLYMQKALELSNQGRFERADNLFLIAEDMLEEATGPLVEVERARIQSYWALHFGNQEQFAEALALAGEATAARHAIAEASAAEFADGDQELTPGRLVGAGAASDLGTEVTDLDMAKRTAFGDIAQSRVTEATILIRDDASEDAEKALEEALVRLKEQPEVPRYWEPAAELLQARTAETRGDLDRAVVLVSRAIDGQRRIFEMSRSEGLGLLFLGRLHEAKGGEAEAAEAYARGIDILSDLHARISVEDALAPLHFLADQHRYGALDTAAIEQRMLALAQLVEPPLTAALVERMAANLSPDDPEARRVLRDLQEAQRDVERINERLAVARATPAELDFTIQSLAQDYALARDAAEQLERQARAAVPGYAQLTREFASVADLRAQLLPGGLVVRLMVGDDQGFAIALTQDAWRSYPVRLSRKSLEQALMDLREPIDQRPGAPLESAWFRNATILHDALFGPIADLVGDADELVIAPSGPLLSVPFAILPTTFSAAMDSQPVPWLARQAPIIVTPSLASFVALRGQAQPSTASLPFAGFGDFVPHGDSDRVLAGLDMPVVACAQQATAIAEIAPLPATGAEVRSVAGTFPDGRVALGADFTEVAVSSVATDGGARVLYFASHGLLPADLGCLPEPGLTTSLPNDADTNLDGVLTASEVVEMNLDADLAVLSACDTAASGRPNGGESLTGLARAFFVAGARAVVATHWKVFDEPTADLMSNMFAFAMSGQDYARALQAAQVRMMDSRSHAHPVYWGAFTYFGA